MLRKNVGDSEVHTSRKALNEMSSGTVERATSLKIKTGRWATDRKRGSYRKTMISAAVRAYRRYDLEAVTASLCMYVCVVNRESAGETERKYTHTSQTSVIVYSARVPQTRSSEFVRESVIQVSGPGSEVPPPVCAVRRGGGRRGKATDGVKV
ncbi:hypothetical protein J6590_027618 [Homalodisca vitripennis]|nr:hypothetical protein J6590_027618 [Homalodisca vitripennis]